MFPQKTWAIPFLVVAHLGLLHYARSAKDALEAETSLSSDLQGDPIYSHIACEEMQATRYRARSPGVVSISRKGRATMRAGYIVLILVASLFMAAAFLVKKYVKYGNVSATPECLYNSTHFNITSQHLRGHAESSPGTYVAVEMCDQVIHRIISGSTSLAEISPELYQEVLQASAADLLQDVDKLYLQDGLMLSTMVDVLVEKHGYKRESILRGDYGG